MTCPLPTKCNAASSVQRPMTSPWSNGRFSRHPPPSCKLCPVGYASLQTTKQRPLLCTVTSPAPAPLCLRPCWTTTSITCSTTSTTRARPELEGPQRRSALACHLPLSLNGKPPGLKGGGDAGTPSHMVKARDHTRRAATLQCISPRMTPSLYPSDFRPVNGSAAFNWTQTSGNTALANHRPR